MAAAAAIAVMVGGFMAPTLQDPTGPAAGPARHVVGLGDSVMAGTGCGCAGIVADYTHRLAAATGADVSGSTLAVPGDTTDDLRRRLAEPATAARVAAADIVLVTVGANDLLPQLDRWRGGGCPPSCYQPAIHTMAAHLAGDLHQIRALRPPGAAPATVLVTTYWNLYPDPRVTARGDPAQLAWSETVTDTADTAICAAAKTADGICVDVDGPFAAAGPDPAPLLAADGDHPSAAGTRLIVNALLAATPRR